MLQAGVAPALTPGLSRAHLLFCYRSAWVAWGSHPADKLIRLVWPPRPRPLVALGRTRTDKLLLLRQVALLFAHESE